ncbi:unnamed protein product [Eruca vesicaria subsp. sativa]|uniref:C2H2-type domain-containing protein n=1 Tax=Eruca vesicaria subsp. sativa TaxID=29727 RepID=A0ABC8L7L2_ERUVS|nr:unnamed protein product [Eruca vesicaria subsp. sativa]
MNGGFGMNNDLTRVPKPQQCSLCKRIFPTTQDLISHTSSVHSHHLHHFNFSPSAAAAPTTFCHYPNPNRNPSPAFPARNRFDFNCYRSGQVEEQKRFFQGSPAITPATNTNGMFGQQEKPMLMNLFPAMPPEGLRTLPLICLEKPIPQDTAMEEDGANSSAVDLTLRL